MGGMKKRRDQGDRILSIAAEKFKAFRIGREGKGATRCPLTDAFETSHQDLLNRLAIEPSRRRGYEFSREGRSSATPGRSAAAGKEK